MFKVYAIVAVVSYLMGSIPFGYILVKFFLKQDIRHTGSGNIGATNVARSGSKGLAIITLLLDAGKGATAVAIGFFLPLYWLRQEDLLVAPLAAFCAIAGHCFTVWLGFRGGKGVATGVGAFLVVAPVATAVSLGIFILIFGVTRYVSLASVLAALAFPLIAYATAANVPHEFLPLAFTCLGPALIIAKHHANLRRLLNGTEPKFGIPKPVLEMDSIEAEKKA